MLSALLAFPDLHDRIVDRVSDYRTEKAAPFNQTQDGLFQKLSRS
jgi:hypothetical protein